MGWTTYQASFYKKGKVDRIAEVTDIINTSSKESGSWEVLKIAQVGSTVYAAIKRTLPEPEEKSFIYAGIYLTSVDNSDYYNFGFKDMDEGCGPNVSTCPNSILNLLSPAEDIYSGDSLKWAKEWREACKKYNQKKNESKKDSNSLNNLPIGSAIEMPYWKGGTIILHKIKNAMFSRPIWVSGTYRYTTATINRQGYKVLDEQENIS